jgi:uncharacterized membrane protein
MTPANDPWNLSGVGAAEITDLSQRPLDWTTFDWMHHFSAHWHNRLVHFPVVLVCVMAALSLSFWHADRRYWPLFKLFWGACVLTLWLAVWTGQRQLDAFAEGSMATFAQWHQWGGFACAIALTLGYLGAVRWPIWSTRAYRCLCVCLWGSVLALMAMATLGGVLSSS